MYSSYQSNSLQETDIINWEKYWTPKLFIENVFGDIREQIDLSVTYDSQGSSDVEILLHK